MAGMRQWYVEEQESKATGAPVATPPGNTERTGAQIAVTGAEAGVANAFARDQVAAQTAIMSGIQRTAGEYDYRTLSFKVPLVRHLSARRRWIAVAVPVAYSTLAYLSLAPLTSWTNGHFDGGRQYTSLFWLLLFQLGPVFAFFRGFFLGSKRLAGLSGALLATLTFSGILATLSRSPAQYLQELPRMIWTLLPIIAGGVVLSLLGAITTQTVLPRVVRAFRKRNVARG